jgi:transmembrane sensor
MCVITVRGLYKNTLENRKIGMTNIDNRLSELAYGFFEGTLSYEEEQTLFGILNGDDEKRAYFNKLEQEWISTHIPSAETSKMWESCWNEIENRENASAKRIKLFARFKIAAAVVALVLLSSLSTYFISNIHTKADTFYTCIAPKGGKSEVVLPDGSHVWLNAGSELSYSAAFDKNNRNVKLSGEGYFEIAKKANGAKFTVSTNGYDVVVHGTKFNVLAYTDEPVVVTTLFEGSVQIDRDDESIMMSPGEKVTYNKVSGELTKAKTSHRANAWVYNNTEYDSITLADLAKVLSRRFDVQISIESEALRSERFAISLNNGEDLEGIMRGLQNIIPIKTVRKGRHIQIEYR